MLFVYWLVVVAVLTVCTYFALYGILRLITGQRDLSGWAKNVHSFGTTLAFAAVGVLNPVYLAYPSWFNDPLVAVTESGEIHELPSYGAFTPLVDGKVLRLSDTFSCNVNRTSVFLTNGAEVLFDTYIPTVEYDVTDHEAFYRHYKMRGKKALCSDVEQIVLNTSLNDMSLLAIRRLPQETRSRYFAARDGLIAAIRARLQEHAKGKGIELKAPSL